MDRRDVCEGAVGVDHVAADGGGHVDVPSARAECFEAESLPMLSAGLTDAERMEAGQQARTTGYGAYRRGDARDVDGSIGSGESILFCLH